MAKKAQILEKSEKETVVDIEIPKPKSLKKTKKPIKPNFNFLKNKGVEIIGTIITLIIVIYGAILFSKQQLNQQKTRIDSFPIKQDNKSVNSNFRGPQSPPPSR